MPKIYQRTEPAWNRLIAKRSVDDESGCWNFTGGLVKGYGVFWFEGRQVKAYRWIYERVVGPIPTGWEVDHLCKNPACFNPDHLEAVTQYENNMRSDSKCATQKRQTECQHGHPLAGTNLIMQGTSRVCRICRNESYKAYRRRKKPPVVALPANSGTARKQDNAIRQAT